jgi:hypothetical protein
MRSAPENQVVASVARSATSCVFFSAISQFERTKIQRRRCTTSERGRALPPRNEARGGFGDAPLVSRRWMSWVLVGSLVPDRADPRKKKLRRGSMSSSSFGVSKLGFEGIRFVVPLRYLTPYPTHCFCMFLPVVLPILLDLLTLAWKVAAWKVNEARPSSSGNEPNYLLLSLSLSSTLSNTRAVFGWGGQRHKATNRQAEQASPPNPQ